MAASDDSKLTSPIAVSILIPVLVASDTLKSIFFSLRGYSWSLGHACLLFNNALLFLI